MDLSHKELGAIADVVNVCISVVGLLVFVYGIECVCTAAHIQRRLSTITRAELDAAFLQHRTRKRVLLLSVVAAIGLALAVLFVAFVVSKREGA